MGITFNPFTGTLDFTGTGGGGGGTPALPFTSVQFNDSGAFGGDADLTWDKTANLMTVSFTGESFDGHVLAVPTDMPAEGQFWGALNGEYLTGTFAANVESDLGNNTIGLQGVVYLEDLDFAGSAAVGVRGTAIIDTEETDSAVTGYGVYGQAYTSNGSAADFTDSPLQLIGVFGQAVHSGTHTLTGAVALMAGSVTKTAGTITNAYGVYVNAVTQGTNNYALFTNAGRVHLGDVIEGIEITAPGAGAANSWRLYGQDNGAGKTQLMIQFATGDAQQLAIQA